MVRVADKVLEDSRPAVLVGENAPNLFTHAGRNVRKEFFSIAEDHGYSVSFLKTSTHLHGIPQKRPRSFYYLWRSETAPKIPTVTRSTPPLGDFLKGYGSADDEQDLGYFDADALMPRYLRDQMGDDWREAWGTGGPDASPPTMFCILLVSQRLYDFLRWCEDVSDDPESDAGYSLVRRFFSNMAEHRGILDCTYMVSHPEGLLRSMMWKTFPNTIHPVYDRCLTRRELARVMDIPEDFPVGELEDPNMMCQNVPGATAMDAVAIAGAFLSGLLEDSGSRVSWTSDFNRHTFAGEDKAWTDERSRLASFDEESREFTLTDEGEAER
jgi:site-specific DNA-cytosine methylase